MSLNPRARTAKKAKSHHPSIARTPIGGLGQGTSAATIRRKRRNQRRRYREKKHLRREAAEATSKAQELVEDTIADAMEGMEIAQARPCQATPRIEYPGMFGRLMAEAARARQHRDPENSETELHFDARIARGIAKLTAGAIIEARKFGFRAANGEDLENLTDEDEDEEEEEEEEEEEAEKEEVEEAVDEEEEEDKQLQGHESGDEETSGEDVDMDAEDDPDATLIDSLDGDTLMDVEEDKGATTPTTKLDSSTAEPKKPTELLDLPNELLAKIAEHAVGAGGRMVFFSNNNDHPTEPRECMSAEHSKGNSCISAFMALRLTNKHLRDIADKSVFLKTILVFEDLDMFNIVINDMCEATRAEIRAVYICSVEGDSKTLDEIMKTLPNLKRILFTPPHVDFTEANEVDQFEKDCRTYIEQIVLTMHQSFTHARRKHGKRNVEIKFEANCEGTWDNYEEKVRRAHLLGHISFEPLSAHDIEQAAWVLNEEFKQMIVAEERRDLEETVEINDLLIDMHNEKNADIRAFLAQPE
ncbi:hypothetical protein BU16DRAFT_554078 [Lophium mytilinum]|uniref:Uncharacterized protein n=1 Tax=Lophium mytilinum TaxID=390894 RepID=A0A6A6RC21_9PEZI|nr:hypothetical protein BU16DRAFT_554078 [Lophium mytilinum]